MTRRCIGLDVHRDFAQVAIWQDGLVRQAGQIAMTTEALRIFADSLAPSDEVALEATGGANAVVRALRAGDPSIGTRAEGESVVIGVWMMQPGDEKIVARRLRQVLEAKG